MDQVYRSRGPRRFGSSWTHDGIGQGAHRSCGARGAHREGSQTKRRPRGNLTVDGNRRLDSGVRPAAVGKNFDERDTVCSALERGNAKMVVGMSSGAERGALL
jgi:hypothetical protein